MCGYDGMIDVCGVFLCLFLEVLNVNEFGVFLVFLVCFLPLLEALLLLLRSDVSYTFQSDMNRASSSTEVVSLLSLF